MSAPTLLRQSRVLTVRGLKHWQREPWTPLFGIAFTIMLVLIFAYLLGGSIQLPGGGDYREYLLPGMFALAMMFGLESTMSSVGADTRRGVTNRFRSMPISSAAVPFGRAGADMMNSAVELAVLMLGGLLIGWRADSVTGALAAIALLLWLRFAMLWVGIYLGLVLRGEGAVSAVQILVWPAGFASAVFVAPEYMPGWLGAVASWNPVSATAAACRELFGNPSGITEGILAEHALTLAVGWPLLLVLVFVPLSARAYRNLGR